MLNHRKLINFLSQSNNLISYLIRSLFLLKFHSVSFANDSGYSFVCGRICLDHWFRGAFSDSGFSACACICAKNAACAEVSLHFVVYAPARGQMLALPDLVVVQEVLPPHSDELLKLAFLLVDLDNFDSMRVVLVLVRQLQWLEGLAEVQELVRKVFGMLALGVGVGRSPGTCLCSWTGCS